MPGLDPRPWGPADAPCGPVAAGPEATTELIGSPCDLLLSRSLGVVAPTARDSLRHAAAPQACGFLCLVDGWNIHV